MKIVAVSVFLLTSLSSAQPISFGLRGGVPFTGAFSDITETSGNSFERTFSNSDEYVIGPMVELHLPLGLSVEADALYHPLNLAQEINNGTTTFHNSMNFNSWEFPILGKYRFLPLPLIKPYVEAGPSFRATGSSVSSYFSKSGFTLGAGVELKLSRLRIEPELRYTRWGSDASIAAVQGFAPSNINQAQFLIGITF
jgi:opacity protein-like surface antigen